MKSIRNRGFLSIIQRMMIALAPLLLMGPASPACASGQEPYTIAVIPSVPPVAMHTQWTPLLERLTQKTGVRFRLKLFDRMAEFEQELGNGSPDFIFASPIQTVVAHKTHRYIPLVRGSKAIAVGLFVRKDSPFKTIDDLSGKTISFVGNKNLCSVFVRHLLVKKDNPLSFASIYAGSTKNVIKSVLIGKSSAGAVFIPELEKELAENREQLRAVIETPKIAPHPLSAHPRVPKDVRGKVAKAMLEIGADREEAELLRTVRLTSPVAADYQRDYQSLEIIDIRELADWGK